MDNKRYRNFSLVTYISSDELTSMLLRNSNVRHYAFIVHDKDLDKLGNLVTPHIHLLVKLYNAQTQSALLRYFKDNINHQNTFCETVKSDNIVNYLTHIGFEDKFSYNQSDIVSDDLSFWLSYQNDNYSDDKAYSIIEDILDGVDMFTLAKRYGRDLIINYNKYLEFANRAFAQRKCNNKFAELIAADKLIPVDDDYP